MNTVNQVQAIIDRDKTAGIPLSDAVWNTAMACVGWSYVYGAWGEICTPANRKRRASDAHPTIVSKCQVLSGKKGTCDGCQWYVNGGHSRIFDCRGFTDWCLKQFGIDLAGEGATSQWNTASNWSAKGTIDTVPDNVLVCLFVKDGSKMQHTGFGYHGATLECSSGVQYFSKRKSKWTHWAIPKGINGDVPTVKPTLRKGSTGPYVVECQEDLISLGYDVGKTGADGIFGKNTEKAVREFQRTHKDMNGKALKVDGIVGEKSWWALDEAIKKTGG